MYVDGTRARADRLLPAPRGAGTLGRRSRNHGGFVPRARRSRTGEDRQPPGEVGRARVCLRVRARAPSLAADRKPSPEETDGSRVARARAARQVGVLLAPARGERATRKSGADDGGGLMDLREQVRERYAAAALAAEGGGCGCQEDGSCCGNVACDGDEAAFGGVLYSTEERGDLPNAAVLASLGCGNPTAVADLREGETVLDLGSGGGIDVILSARRVGPTGVAYGLDMTDEMLALARQNAREAKITNAHFLKGVIEEIPLPAESVDVVISNCVINLSTEDR